MNLSVMVQQVITKLLDHSCVYLVALVVHVFCGQSPLTPYVVIPLRDLIHYNAEFHFHGVGGTSHEEKQNEICVGSNGKFYCNMAELFSQRPLHPAKRQSCGKIIKVLCVSRLMRGMVMVRYKAVLSEQSDQFSG